jgi:uncharacterized protein
VVEMNLPMEVRLVKANDNLKEDNGKVAVERGPLVYCAEWIDNRGKASNILMPTNASFTSELTTELNGVEVLKTTVPVVVINSEGNSITTLTKPVTLIPYYAWANRGAGEMVIWFPSTIKEVDLLATDGTGKPGKPK